MHHAGVRPLPKCDDDTASAIPRGHSVEESELNGIPVLTLVGGKLTTCRSLAEEVCTSICTMQHHPRKHSTAERQIPGARDVHQDSPSAEQLTELAGQYNLHVDQVAAVWPLIGNQFDEVFALHDAASEDVKNTLDHSGSLVGTNIPKTFVRWSIDREWCTKLEDLIERRLMLIFHATIRRATLEDLATELVNAGRLETSGIDEEIEHASQRLQKLYGKSMVRD